MRSRVLLLALYLTWGTIAPAVAEEGFATENGSGGGSETELVTAPFELEVRFPGEPPPDPANPSREVPVFLATPLDRQGLSSGPTSPVESRLLEEDQGGIRVRLELAEGFWRIDPRIEGLWIPEVLVEVFPEQVSMPSTIVEAKPGAILNAEIGYPDTEELPLDDLLEIRVVSAKHAKDLVQPHALERMESSCAWMPEAPAWNCPIPAGTADFKIELRGFVPHYFWARSIEPGQVEDLGTITFEKGSSMVGWVVHPEASDNVTETTIELTPILGDGMRHPAFDMEDARAGIRSHRTHPNERGFFRFVGLEAGTYSLEASAEGLAEYETSPVPIVEGRETSLAEPVILSPPGSLTVFIEPALSPSGEPWTLRLTEADTSVHDSTIEEWADLSGTWIAEGLDPGTYELMLLGGEGRKKERWLREEVELAGDTMHSLELPIVEVEGSIVRGSAEVDGVVWFGRRFGETSIRMESTEDEGFHGFLPRAGEWEVDVELSKGAIQQLDPVRVERRSDGEPTEVEIEIPFTNIFGSVVGREERPIARANVLAMKTEGERLIGQTTTDENGEFEMKGLQPGRLWLAAVAREGMSEPILVDLREGLRTEPTELRLEPPVARKIRVVSDTGPVAGASVWYRPVGQGPRIDGHARSNPEGYTILDVHDSATAVDLLVLPGSLAMRAERLALSGDPEIVPELAVSRYGSTLGLDVGTRSAGEVVLFNDGVQLMSNPLFRWLQLTTGQDIDLRQLGKIVLPQSDWGFYALCPREMMSLELRQTLEARGLPQECSGGYLAPGGFLPLSLDKDASDSAE